MERWNFKSGERASDKWPKLESGEPVTPAFLLHISGGPLDTELTINLLEAYDIPTLCYYPNDGLFGKLILGYPAAGIDLYVPETLLVDAQNLLNADIVEDEAEEIEE